MSPLVKAGIQSLVVILIIGLLFGTGAGFIAGAKIGAGVTIIAIVGQILISYIYHIQLERKQEETADQVAERISNNILQNASAFRIPMQLTCAYCSVANKVPISLLEDNGFKCITCNQPNGVFIQFTTSRITQPLSPIVETKELDIEGTMRQTTINEPIKTI